VVRQRRAIGADGDRTEALKGLKIPTVVLHGADDPLVQLRDGEATAAAIPGAELRVVPGMGHDLPPGLYDTFVDAILAAAARAGT
jgi:pimeloyl-ACP methyl ester carboxylesterase